MVEHLAHDLGSLRPGDHLCLPYEDSDERNQAIVPFIAEGLARGERCVYLVEADQRDALLGVLSAAGVNAGRALDRGALWLRTPAETYFRSGKFDPDDTLALVDELLESAVADGFTGLRASGEIAPSQRQGVPWDQIFSYEARFNERFVRRPIAALCRYHRAASPPATIADALRTHPTAVVSGRVCRNSYYEKPDVALAGDAERVEWMLHQLRRSSASDLRALAMTRTLAGETSRLAAENQSRARSEEELVRAVRLRDHFLDDLTRELAAPVAGLAAEIETLAKVSPADPRGRDDHSASATLVKHLKRLGSVVEQLKEVSRLTNRQTPQPIEDVDLVDVARQVMLRNRDRLAALGASVSFRTEPRIQGRWERRRLEQLLTNLLLSAAKLGASQQHPGASQQHPGASQQHPGASQQHPGASQQHPGASQQIDLELSADGGIALISVGYRGTTQAYDDDAAAVFEQGARARGGEVGTVAPEGRVGLWMAREIASAFGGTLRLPGSVGGAALVTVELPRSGPRSWIRAPSSRPASS